MKGVRCSWVDMSRIREALSADAHGDGTRLANMRCVENSTVSKWKAACMVLDAINGKVSVPTLLVFQPTHAEEIGRHFRKLRGKAWDEDTREEIADWVHRCECENLTVNELRAALLKARSTPAEQYETVKVEDITQLTGKKFGTIYIDPPWQYGNQATRASTNNHYRTMPIEEIKAIPVGELAAQQCHLHLWTTVGFTHEAFHLIEAWGFEFKSEFVWIKPQMGLGNYYRLGHEKLLLGVRGLNELLDRSQVSWLLEDRGKHSRKPYTVRKMLEKISPGPRLELFAREVAHGWTAWGDIPDGLYDDIKENQ